MKHIRLDGHSGTDASGNTAYAWDYSGHDARLAKALNDHGCRLTDSGDEMGDDGYIHQWITDDQYASLPSRLRRRVDSRLA